MAYDGAEKDKPETSSRTDEELLKIVADERKRSIGFDHDSDLLGEREVALNYIKGEMPDIPSLPNRSKAVSSDINDAIETLMPDLMEIFTGGDDVVTFIPHGQEDEEAARQETDYLSQVVFQQNGGFRTLYAMFKDALQVKTGVVKWWWDEDEPEPETLEGKSEEEAVAIVQQPGVKVTDINPGEEPQTYDLTIAPKIKGKVCIKAIPPEDFTVAADTVMLADATYCAARFRPRKQDLIAQGISKDIVDSLPAYGSNRDDQTDQARDTASENEFNRYGGGIGDMVQVETVEHYIRLEEGGKLQLRRIVTGGGETVLISNDKVDRVQFAAITPYMVTHRFYGRSVSDLLMEVQRIKTALTRAYLDSIYFALNQRMEVADSGTNEFTIADLLNNTPGMPIRVKTTGTVTPMQAGGAGFNGLEALEYFATVAESRTGIVRNAQGLNPDTLHETARGAMALMSAAAKRTRMIARIFAETGVKDLMLGVHALLRSRGEQKIMTRLRGKWVPIDPSSWGAREDMSIEIGVGSGGKEAELAQIMQEMTVVQQVITLQGGEGPIVTWQNLYELIKRFFEKGGCKAPEAYLTDPSSDEMKAQMAQKAQQPNPEQQKVQAQIQGDQAKAQSDAQIEMQRTQAKMAMDQQSAQHALQLQAQKNQLDMQLAREKQAHDLELKSQQAQLEAQLKQREMEFDLQLKEREVDARIKTQASVAGAEFGGKVG